MPIMPRTNKKCQKIVETILGKKPKKKDNEERPQTETERRIASEETSRIR
jgi:hypothetical protein